MITTYHDDGFSERLSTLMNCVIYEQEIPAKSNAYELAAARQLLRMHDKLDAAEKSVEFPDHNCEISMGYCPICGLDDGTR